MNALLVAALASRISLTLVPPPPVTARITLDVRAAVFNDAAAPRNHQVSVYLDREAPASRLHRETLQVPGNSARGVYFRWPARDHAGRHDLILVAKSGRSISSTRLTAPPARSTAPGSASSSPTTKRASA